MLRFIVPFAAAALLCAPATAATATNLTNGENTMTDHAHDFDFLIGK